MSELESEGDAFNLGKSDFRILNRVREDWGGLAQGLGEEAGVDGFYDIGCRKIGGGESIGIPIIRILMDIY